MIFSESPLLKLTESEETQATLHALQLISKYMNNYWRNMLIKKLSLDPESLLSFKEQKSNGQKQVVSVCLQDKDSKKLIQYTTRNMGKVNKDNTHKQRKTEVMDTQSPGLKWLAKNVKGVKSLSSFLA